MNTIFEELGGTYHDENSYLIPDLIAPESPNIGVWGGRRRRFLREHKHPIYVAMMMNDTLNAHLEEVDRSAEEMLDRLMKQTADREGVTEKLKAEDQMEWIRRMNSIKARAEEIIWAELIN